MEQRPPTPPESTYAPTDLPSSGARVAAFVAILLGGLCGGLIGYAFADLQGAGTAVSGILGVLAAVAGAVGVGVVAVLALRAMAEWRPVEQRQSARSAGGGSPRRS